MDSNSFSGVLRALVPALIAYVAGKGWIPAGSVADITAAAVAVSAAVWSIISNKPAA